jgi:hypothetical protein
MQKVELKLINPVNQSEKDRLTSMSNSDNENRITSLPTAK